MPISSNNNPTETLGGLPQPAPNNNGTKRHSLLVTLDDGTTTETQGSVTNLATLHQLQTSPTPPLPLGMFWKKYSLLHEPKTATGNINSKNNLFVVKCF